MVFPDVQWIFRHAERWTVYCYEQRPATVCIFVLCCVVSARLWHFCRVHWVTVIINPPLHDFIWHRVWVARQIHWKCFACTQRSPSNMYYWLFIGPMLLERGLQIRIPNLTPAHTVIMQLWTAKHSTYVVLLPAFERFCNYFDTKIRNRANQR